MRERLLRTTLAGLLAGLSLLVALPAAAQVPGESESEDRADFALEVPVLRILIIDEPRLNFELSEEDVLNGVSRPLGTNARISSNQPWALRVYGTSPTWIGPSQKPVTDIEWSADGSAFRPLTQDPVIALEDAAVRNLVMPFQFQVRVNLERDEPGVYTYDAIIYELGTP